MTLHVGVGWVKMPYFSVMYLLNDPKDDLISQAIELEIMKFFFIKGLSTKKIQVKLNEKAQKVIKESFYFIEKAQSVPEILDLAESAISKT